MSVMKIPNLPSISPSLRSSTYLRGMLGRSGGLNLFCRMKCDPHFVCHVILDMAKKVHIGDLQGVNQCDRVKFIE